MKRIALIVFIVFSSAANALERQLITLYAYHLKPPFIVDIANEKGLYYDLATYLNIKQKKYEFRTVFVPRKRLDRYLSNKKLDGLVIGVSPMWFNDKNETVYLWSDSFYQDRDLVISSTKKPIDYQEPNSLLNTRIAGVRGFKYFGIDPLVNSGKVVREDTVGEYEVVEMVLKNRADAGIVSESTLLYLNARNDWQGQLFYATNPHDQYTRRILIPEKFSDVLSTINPLVKDIQTDSLWLSFLDNYYSQQNLN
ncbi:polar amino acid transport system substrate-binding protein [Pseudoalteromonas ulvae UL12]|uniref:transporter substrate-binding domain-containing protein n=1 Tax=Pseudoalteromonas ulvae TaxID=107327 RepID=UPI0015931399|nr:transporter substrate-binding domain-containing protein [Pseudoalteromonas ulvae]MBE0366095.1 polar amino acid transport system substrate-binding protein [Pseudoalteromonas ulvae UL12]